MHERARGWVVVTAAVLLVVGCVVGSVMPGSQPPPAAAGWRIVDADPHGAIIFGGRDHEYRGIGRDGVTRWRKRTGQPVVGCMRVCPQAIPSTVDFARSVLWADSVQNMVSVKGTELDLAGRPMRVGGQFTSWHTSADGQHALAVTTVPVQLNSEVRWFDLTTGGWRLSSPVVTVPGPRDRACVSPEGTRAVLLGAAPSLLDRKGYQARVPEIARASGCAYTRSHTVVVEFAAGAGGLYRTRLRALDPRGTVVWRQDFLGLAAVCGDVTSSRLLWVLGGILYQAQVGHDVILRSIPGVVAACFDGEGGLVVVDPAGTTRWLD